MIRRLWTAFVILVMAGLGVALGVGLAQVNDTSRDLDRTQAEVTQLRSVVTQANNRLEEQGAPTVVVPDPVTADPPGLFEGKEGKEGRAGTDAPAPTSDQMLTAVAAFCANTIDV